MKKTYANFNYSFKMNKDWDGNIEIVANEIIKFCKSFTDIEKLDEAIYRGQLSAVIHNSGVNSLFERKASILINKMLGHPKRKYIEDLSEIINL